MLTRPSKISPEADFGNFSKSLQQWRTANPREILSRMHPSTLQTEPRGEKHIFCNFFNIPRKMLKKCWKTCEIYNISINFLKNWWVFEGQVHFVL